MLVMKLIDVLCVELRMKFIGFSTVAAGKIIAYNVFSTALSRE